MFSSYYLRFLSCFIGVLALWMPDTNGQSVAHQRCTAFEKGLNISNWLESVWQTNWPTENGYTKSDLQDMKDAGITSLRLPIQFAAVVDTVAPYTVDTAHVLFSRVDTVIAWATELDMRVIIDNHHGWDLTTENWRSKMDAFTHLWSVLAKRYSTLDPEMFTFELLNEPAILFPNDSLRIIFSTAIDSIRQHTTAHTIIVSPHFGSSALALPLMQPYADTNLIYTWHTYDPLDFTHQGLTWNEPFFPSGNPFPHEDTTLLETWVYDGWQNVQNWKNEYGLPLFLGEFGVCNYADDESACNWMTLIGTNLRDMEIPWFYWDWRYDFAMFNSSTVSADSIIPCFRTALGLYGDNSLGVAQPTHQSTAMDVLLYPNPVTVGEFFTLQLPFQSESTVQVTDMTGRLVAHITTNEIDVRLVAPVSRGLYYVTITQEKYVGRVKLLVQ